MKRLLPALALAFIAYPAACGFAPPSSEVTQGDPKATPACAPRAARRAAVTAELAALEREITALLR